MTLKAHSTPFGAHILLLLFLLTLTLHPVAPSPTQVLLDLGAIEEAAYRSSPQDEGPPRVGEAKTEVTRTFYEVPKAHEERVYGAGIRQGERLLHPVRSTTGGDDEITERLTTWTEDPVSLPNSDRITMWEIVTSMVTPESTIDSSSTSDIHETPNYRILQPIPEADVVVEEVHQQPLGTEKEEGEKTKEEEEEEEKKKEEEKINDEEISKRTANVDPGEEIFARPQTPSSLLVASRGDLFTARRRPGGHEQLVAEHKAAGALHFENDVDYGNDADPYYYWDIQGDADDYSESELPLRGVHAAGGGSSFLRPASLGSRLPPTSQLPSPQPQGPTFIRNNPPTLPVHSKPVDSFKPPTIPPVIPLALMPALRERLSQMMSEGLPPGQQTVSPEMIHRLVQQLHKNNPLRQGPPSSQNYPSVNNQGQVPQFRPQSAPGASKEPPQPLQSSQILRDSIMGYPVGTAAPGSNVETFNIVITKDMTGGQRKPTVQYYPDAKVESILLNTTIDSVTDIASLKKVVSNAVSSSVRNEPVSLQEALAQVVEVPGQEPKINVLNSTIPDLNELEDTINNLLGSSVVYEENQASNTAVGHIPNYNGSVVNNLLNKTVGVQNLHVNSTSKTNVVNIFIINILGNEEPTGQRPAMPHLDRVNQGSSASPADAHSSSLLRPAVNKIPVRSSLPPLNNDQKVVHSPTSSQHTVQSSSQTELLNENRPPSVVPPRDTSGAGQQGGSSLHIPAKTDPNMNSGGINLNKNDVLNLLPEFVRATTIPPVVPLYDTSVHEVLGQKPSVLGLLPSSLFDVSSPKRHGLGNQTVGGVIRKRPIADLTAYFGVNRSPVIATQENIGNQQIPRHNNPLTSSQTNHAPNTPHPVAVNRVQLVESQSTNETQPSSPDRRPSPGHSTSNDNKTDKSPVPAFGSARRPNTGQSPYQPFTIVNPEQPHQGVQNINLFDIANNNQRANGGSSASTAQTGSQQKDVRVQSGLKKQPAKQEHKVQENLRSQVAGIVPTTKAPVPATDSSSSSIDMSKLMKAVAIGALPSGIAFATALWPYWAPAVLGKRRRRDVLSPNDDVEARGEISQDWLSILLGTRYSQGGTVNWKGHEGVKFPIPGMGNGKNDVAKGSQELEPDTTTGTSQLNNKTPLSSIPSATESVTETTKEDDATTSSETSQETITQGNNEPTSSDDVPSDKLVSQSSNLYDQTFTMSTTLPITEVEESMDSSKITETTKIPIPTAFTESMGTEDDSTELELTPEGTIKTTVSSAATIESNLEGHATKVDGQEITLPEDNVDISSTTVKTSTKEPVTEMMPTTGREGTGTVSQIGGSYTSSDSVFSKPLIVLDGVTTKAQSDNENVKNGNDVALVSNFLYSTLNDWKDENGNSKVTDKTEPQQVSDTTEGFPHNDLIELDINTQPVSQMVSGVTNSPIVFINGVPIISSNVPKTAKPLGSLGVQRPIYTVQTHRPSIQGASFSRIPVRNSVTSYLPLSSSSSSSISATPSLSNLSPSVSHSSSPTSYSTLSALLSSASSSATATQKPVVYINNQAVTMSDLMLKSPSLLPTTKRPMARPTRKPSGAATPVLTTWFNRDGQGVTTSEFSRLPVNYVTRITSTDSSGKDTAIVSSNTPRITTTARPRVTTARPRITSLRPRRTTLRPLSTTVRPRTTATRRTVQTTTPKTTSTTPRPTTTEIRTTTINLRGTTTKPTTKPPAPSGSTTKLPVRVGTTTKATMNDTATATTPPTITTTTESPVLFGMTSKQLSRAASFVGSVTVYGAAALMPLWLPIVLGKRRRKRDLDSEDDFPEFLQTLEAIQELPELKERTEMEGPTKDTSKSSSPAGDSENETPEHLIEEEFDSKTEVRPARFSDILKKNVPFPRDLDKESRT